MKNEMFYYSIIMFFKKKKLEFVIFGVCYVYVLFINIYGFGCLMLFFIESIDWLYKKYLKSKFIKF